MPQVDLETLVSACAGGSLDRKIACETQADNLAGGQDRPEEEDTEEPAVPPDFPPESFWLSKDAEFDWFDRNAFYERKDSTKGNSNSCNLNPNLNSHSNSNSQRFSLNLKSKAGIIGLPKTQKHNYVDTKNRRNGKPGNTRLFPKRSGSLGKSDAPMIEPSSPKVSCMGRVRSKRDRKRRLRNRPRSTETSMEKAIKPVERRKTGFLASFRAMFRHGRSEKPVKSLFAAESPPRNSGVVSTRARDRAVAYDFDTLSVDSFPRHSVEGEPPGLGGMKRFVSGRRSGSWVGEGGIEVS